MKTRRHHNNRGAKTVRLGLTGRALHWIGKKLGIPVSADGAAKVKRLKRG